ncbi:MAG: M48 family metallopeptidase [Chloroflexi bacterium]|nr:M48 family metallopeptidase [Chloroflexota bacterium]
MVNLFFVIILAALILDFFLDVVANLLNLGALKLEPPAALRGVYDPEYYQRSQEYTRSATQFQLIAGTFNLGVLLSFWIAGGFNYLDLLVRGPGFAPIINGLLYFGVLLAAYAVLTLPFSVYATFVIEERFGFNRTTPRLFVIDRLKGLALVVLFGGPLLAGVLGLFEYAGRYAWIYAWGSVTLFSLFIAYVAPTWIMPLFNKFTPMASGGLRDAILKYAGSVNFPVKNIFIMDGSKRTSRANAFFTGFGRNKRIALFDTLIAQHTVAEMVAILAHEIGHYKKKHVLQGTIVSILHSGVMFFLLSVFVGSQGLYDAFSMEQPSVYAGLVFFGLLYTPLEMVLSIFFHMVSRTNERGADRFAGETIDEPASLVEALKKLSASNLSNLSPHPFYVFLNYSHPPLLERIQAIERTMKTHVFENKEQDQDRA